MDEISQLTTYPTGDKSDPSILYTGLGTFWTNVFQGKEMLSGLTLEQSENLLQLYIELVDVLNSYSVHNIPVFDTNKWYPLVIYKSQYNRVPLIYNPDDAVYGVQPADDPFFQNAVFRYGFPKSPTTSVYLHQPPEVFKDFGIFANRVIDPTRLLVKGTDVSWDRNGALVFNQDLFEDPEISKTSVIAENGTPVTYTDEAGNEIQEEFVLIWAYNGQLDADRIFEAFGQIFEVRKESSQFYKDLLRGLMNLSVEGPTVAAISQAVSGILNVPVIRAPEEYLQDYFQAGGYKHVITDKNTYKFDQRYAYSFDDTLMKSQNVGTRFLAGEAVCNAIIYRDNVKSPGWWKNDLGPFLALSMTAFAGEYEEQLYFENELKLFSLDGSGNIVFPVLGKEEDVATFNAYINDPSRQDQVKEYLGLSSSSPVLNLNPVDVLFEGVLKYNTAFIAIQVIDTGEFGEFLGLFDEISPYLPRHVYFLTSITLNADFEEFANLNDTYWADEAETDRRNADASKTGISEGEAVPGSEWSDLFLITRSPIDGSPADPFVGGLPLDNVTCNSTTDTQAEVNAGQEAYRTSGKVVLLDFS